MTSNSPTTSTRNSITTTNIPTGAMALSSAHHTWSLPFPTKTAVISSSSGLSSSAKVGIGLGVPLGLIIIGMIVSFLIYRQRNHKRKSISGERDPNAIGGAVSTRGFNAKRLWSWRKSDEIKELKHDIDHITSELATSGAVTGMKHEIKPDAEGNIHELNANARCPTSKNLPSSRHTELPDSSRN